MLEKLKRRSVQQSYGDLEARAQERIDATAASPMDTEEGEKNRSGRTMSSLTKFNVGTYNVRGVSTGIEGVQERRREKQIPD